jgi:hypothetical protein
LYFYGVIWFDSAPGRFTSPDTIIPEASQGVQAWDRYACGSNNPSRFIDPSGHSVECGVGDYGCEAGRLSFDGLVHLWTDYSHRFSRQELFAKKPPQEFLLDFGWNVHCPKCHQWTPEESRKYQAESFCGDNQFCINVLIALINTQNKAPRENQGPFPSNSFPTPPGLVPFNPIIGIPMIVIGWVIFLTETIPDVNDATNNPCNNVKPPCPTPRPFLK